MVDPSLVSSLRQVVGDEHVLIDLDDLDYYSGDALSPSRAFRASGLLEKTADLVVAPRSADEVAETVKLAVSSGTPIVPRGGGTGVMGAALPVLGGIVLDLKRLNTVIDIDPQSRMVQVEAGAVLEDVNNALHEHGMMLGHDPWSVPIATIGGTISTNGVGYLAAAHGPMGEQVLGLEAVLPTSQLLSTPPVPKYSAGPNLNHLFVGAEGVFGVITQASLRIAPVPEERVFIAFRFPTFDHGFNAIAEAFSLGLRPTLMDLTEEGSGTVLYLMFQGYRELVETEVSRCRLLCAQHNGADLGPGPNHSSTGKTGTMLPSTTVTKCSTCRGRSGGPDGAGASTISTWPCQSRGCWTTASGRPSCWRNEVSRCGNTPSGDVLSSSPCWCAPPPTKWTLQSLPTPSMMCCV